MIAEPAMGDAVVALHRVEHALDHRPGQLVAQVGRRPWAPRSRAAGPSPGGRPRACRSSGPGCRRAGSSAAYRVSRARRRRSRSGSRTWASSRSIVCGSSPSPGVERHLERGGDLAEQRLPGAHRGRAALGEHALLGLATACAARSAASPPGSGGRGPPRARRTARGRAPRAARSTRARRSAGALRRLDQAAVDRGREVLVLLARSRPPTRAGGRRSSTRDSSLSIAASSASASASAGGVDRREARPGSGASKARGSGRGRASRRRRASSASATSGERSQWTPAARGPEGAVSVAVRHRRSATVGSAAWPDRRTADGASRRVSKQPSSASRREGRVAGVARAQRPRRGGGSPSRPWRPGRARRASVAKASRALGRVVGPVDLDARAGPRPARRPHERRRARPGPCAARPGGPATGAPPDVAHQPHRLLGAEALVRHGGGAAVVRGSGRTRPGGRARDRRRRRRRRCAAGRSARAARAFTSARSTGAPAAASRATIRAARVARAARSSSRRSRRGCGRRLAEVAQQVHASPRAPRTDSSTPGTTRTPRRAPARDAPRPPRPACRGR